MDQERRIFELQAEICQALASPKRLEILYTLRDGELPAGELARRLGISTANLSQHLSIMRQTGLLDSRKEGLNVYYRLAIPEILAACGILRQVLAEHLARRSEILQAVDQRAE